MRQSEKLNRYTIKDVAKLAGVGIGTVSRVLNGSGPVGKTTKEAIEKAIEELQFRPHVMARGLRTSKLPTIGMIVSDITNPLFAEVVQAAHEVLINNGFELVLGITNNDPKEDERTLMSFEYQGVSGIIASLNDDTNVRTREIIEGMDIPLILLDRQLLDYKMDSIVYGYNEGSEEAIDYLVNLGHQKISLVLGSSKTAAQRKRKTILLNRLKFHNINLMDEYICELESPKEGFSMMASLLEKKDRPTAVIVGNNQIFVGVLKALRNKNLKYPDDISLITYDDINLTQLLETPVTVIKRNLKELGVEAAKLVINKVENQSDEIIEQILPTWLEIRESCKSVN